MTIYEYIVIYMAIMSIIGMYTTWRWAKNLFTSIATKPVTPPKPAEKPVIHIPKNGKRKYEVNVEACEAYLKSRAVP